MLTPNFSGSLPSSLPAFMPPAAAISGNSSSLNHSNQDAVESGSSAGTFSQTLSREVAERRQNAASDSNKDAVNHPPASHVSSTQTVKEAAKEPGKPDSARQDSKEKDASEGTTTEADKTTVTATATVPAGPVDMLALVNSLQPGVAQGKTATLAAGGDTKIEATGSKGDPGLLLETGSTKKLPNALPDAAVGTVSDKAAADALATARLLDTVLKTPEIQDGKRVETSALTGSLNNSLNSAALLANAAPLAPIASALPGLYGSDKLTPRVGSANWDQALSQRVVWMASSNQQTASLTLNPPDLGPLQIVLNVTNDQASASFTAAQPEVRQALEAAMPRLREMMSDAGIQLGQTSVSANGGQQQFAQRQEASGRSGHNESDETPGTVGNLSSGTLLQRAGRGLVDTFA